MVCRQLENDSPRCFNELIPPGKARLSLGPPHFLVPRCRSGIEMVKVVAGYMRVRGDAVNTATGRN